MINLSKNQIRKYLKYDIVPNGMTIGERIFLEHLKSGNKITLDLLQYIVHDIKGSYLYDSENGCYIVFSSGYVVSTRKCKSMSIVAYR